MTDHEEPTTDLAGKVRALPEQGVPNIGGHSLVQRDAVLALVAVPEARATATPGLDVERLARAIHATGDGCVADEDQPQCSAGRAHKRHAERLAAEYAALSNTPSRETGLTAAGTALLREWGPSDDMEGSAHSDFRAAIRKVEAEARAQGALHEILIREAEDEARATGLPPGTRIRHVGPSCNWLDHHWTADQWDQTVCAACGSIIEPIPTPKADD